MGAEDIKVTYFKNKIEKRLEELRPYMSDVKYRLYTSMIKDCTSFDQVREMAELDMQFNMIKYVKELEEKLKLSDTNIEELEAVTNQNAKAAKLTVIKPKKKEEKTNLDIANDIDLSSLCEDLEDDELLASAANLLMMRLNNMPDEEKYRDALVDYEEDELTVDAIDNLEIDDSEIDGDDTEESEEEDNDDFDIDIDESELGLDDNSEESEEEDNDFELDLAPDVESELEEEYNEQDIRDIEPDFSNEAEDEDDILDFGDTKTNENVNDEATFSLDDLDSINDSDIFVDDDTEESEDENSFSLDDLDSLDDSDIFVEDDTEEDEEETDETDWETLGDDLFQDDIDEENEEESIDDEIDSLGDDLFVDDDSEEEDDTEEDIDDAIDDIDESDFDLGEDEDESGDDEEDSEEDELDSIDNLVPDDLFGDDEESEENEQESEEDDFDSMFDIDESELGFEEPDDEVDDTAFYNRTPQTKKATPPVQRQKTLNKVFENGTSRGAQTQKMFNMLTGLVGNTGSGFKKLTAAFNKKNTRN